jgi:hypothetical protein
MSDTMRDGEFRPAGASRTPMDDSSEQRLVQWEGDHVAGTPEPPEPDVDRWVSGETEILGVSPAELPDEDLFREMHSLHRTRLDTLRHAADSALANNLRRTAELETEYLTRHPGREVDPGRLRDA